MKRPILWITIITICGIYMRLGRSELVCLALFISIVIKLSQIVIIEGSIKYMGFILFLLFGFIYAGTATADENAINAQDIVVSGSGVVKDAGVTKSGNQKLTILGDIESKDGFVSQSVKLYAIWSGEGRVAAGDQISFEAELSAFNHQTVPGGYDEELYLRTKGYDYKIYPIWMEYSGKDDSVSSVLAGARGTVHHIFDQILPEKESGIMKAMLTGDREDIPEDGYKLYTKAGIVHVLCISGLHMNCLALYVSFFMEKILKQSRRKSAAVTMLAAVFFLIFTGFTPSAVRAVTMICVVMGGRLVFRSHDRLNEIAVAALLILLIEPLYLFHIGFQLSFITVLGLCLAADQIQTNKNRNWSDWLKDAAKFSFYASAFSMPVVAYHFHSVSLVGILANLAIIPLSGLLLGFGILSAVLGAISLPLGIFAAGSVYAILQFFEWICTLLLQLPFSYVLTGCPSEATILLLYGLLFCWVKYRNHRHGWKAAVCLSALLFFSVYQNQFFQKETTVAFLDVGQGDCAVISTFDHQTYLVDGGGQFGREFGENVGKYTVLPYLEYLGTEELDGVFLSHPDKDHMMGLLEVLETVPTKAFYVSAYPFAETEEVLFLKEMVEKYEIPMYTVKAGDGDGPFTCLYPADDMRTEDDNHGSMVLEYSCGNTDVLFTGDISEEEEEFLLQEDISAEILKVAHHGSRYSSGSAFLEAVSPEAAIISCGKDNIYGHPHESVLERIKSAGTQEVYRTDTDGSVLVRIKKDGGYSIETMEARKSLYENIKEKLEKE